MLFALLTKVPVGLNCPRGPTWQVLLQVVHPALLHLEAHIFDEQRNVKTSVLDPHTLYADPDPAF
jgi:hypothetical protein